jgi:uncharacterized protein (TIGR00255 family)
MLTSMTGFGQSEFSYGSANLKVEVKSVNSRFLDISARLPAQLNCLEDFIRKEVKKYVNRGRIDIWVGPNLMNNGDGTVEINEKLALDYKKALEKLARKLKLPANIDINEISKLPNVVTYEKLPIDTEKIWKLLRPALRKALKTMQEMRRTEGHNTSKELGNILGLLEGKIDIIKKRAGIATTEVRGKLLEKLKKFDINEQVDQTRLEAEVAMIVQRGDVTEEIARLKSHIIQSKKLMRSREKAGKTLDFTIQEMLREVNTIGSKVSDIQITNAVISSKGFLEQLKEQVQNIE